MTLRTVACPTCKREIPWSTENRHRPFCSERCRQIDLGAWANEEYRIPAAASLDHVNPDLPTPHE